MATGTAHAVTYLPGTYTFTALTAGTYAISSQGAQGGSAFGNGPNVSGGFGAVALGNFTLTAGEQLGIVVGNVGAFNGTFGGGGGGSFVYVVATNALLVAGGGGGGATSVNNAAGGNPSNGGNASTASSALTESGGSVAGVNGMTGNCCGFGAGPGTGGQSFLNIASGAGYLGGGSISLATQGGAGLVTITPALQASVPEPGSWAMFIGGFGLVGSALRRRRGHVGVKFV